MIKIRLFAFFLLVLCVGVLSSCTTTTVMNFDRSDFNEAKPKVVVHKQTCCGWRARFK